MKTILITLVVLFTIHSPSVCQTKDDTCSIDRFNKNFVYVTLGMFPSLAYNINYERKMWHPFKNSESSVNLRIGYGGYSDLGGSNEMCMLSSNFIWGSNSSHFESDLGVSLLFNIERYLNYKKYDFEHPLLT